MVIIIPIALVILLLIWGIVTYNRLVTESSGGGFSDSGGGSDSGSGGAFID